MTKLTFSTGALFLTFAASPALAVATFNGPSMDGSRIAQAKPEQRLQDLDDVWSGGMGDSCMPTQGCPTNGPALDGLRSGSTPTPAE
ncbi:hypothetical protein [Dinoroseobacter sp. S76]|uniref:hypothetical protein n=1 Tax=Dinoroseobacter sp. S76 TaxID=3415124 RepID=UPI003C7D64C8